MVPNIFSPRCRAAVAAAFMIAAPALAQSQPLPSAGATDRTSGGTADRTGSIAPTGQTKPPGAPVADEPGTSPELQRKNREIDREMSRGICKGCD